jgi:hypothetical protein
VVAFAQWLACLPLLAGAALLAALYTIAADRPRRVAAAGFFTLEGRPSSPVPGGVRRRW